MDQQIIRLYDRFTHGGMNRREFLDRLAELAGSTAAAVALLPLLQNDYAQAAIIAPDDGRLVTERVSYEFAQGQDQRLSRARQSEGQTPRGHRHPREPRAQSAYRGYRASIGGRGLSRAGARSAVRQRRHAADEDRARELHQKTERENMIAAALAAIPFMQKHAESTGKVGAVGFCFGGGVVNRMAAGSPDLGAAVPYYGVQIPVEMVPAIKAPLLLQYAENDENINKGIGAYETALAANNKKYTIYIYPGTQHAFNNDTGAARYNKAAAELAWSRTLAFFAENLGAPPKAA